MAPTILLTLVALLSTTAAWAENLATPLRKKSPPLPSYVREILSKEPVWPSLNSFEEDYTRRWKIESLSPSLAKLAEVIPLSQFESQAAAIWEKFADCAGDIPRARKEYEEGRSCKSNPSARQEFAELQTSLRAYLRTTQIQVASETVEKDVEFWRAHAISSSPLLNELLLEAVAANSISFDVDRHGAFTSFHKSTNNEQIRATLRERLIVVNNAARALTLTARNCQDFGLWPTAVAGVVGVINTTEFFTTGAKDQPGVLPYKETLKKIYELACGPELPQTPTIFFDGIGERTKFFGIIQPQYSFHFYRRLAYQNLKSYGKIK
jgi:hypothetical protein